MSQGTRKDSKAGGPQKTQYPPLTGVTLAVVTIALPLATFMQSLNTTIANVAVPTIAGALGASSTQGTWLITSYSIANAIMLPTSGWLARRFGEVRIFLLSTSLFVISSLLCGLATNLETLVLFRVIQGAVAGPLLPLSQSLLFNSYPKEKIFMAISLWSMVISVAPICGPVVGGWISDNYAWNWIFFINVPVGTLVVFLIKGILGQRETTRIQLPISYVGLGLLVIGIGSLQMMLDQGRELDWFNSNVVITLTIMAVVALTLLVVWELMDQNPVLDLRMFASRNFTVAVICISAGRMAWFGTVVLLPLLLQTQYGYTATLAGLAVAPLGLLQLFLMPIYGKYAKHFDPRVLVTWSFLIFAGCMYVRTWFSPEISIWFIVIPQLLLGLGNMLYFPSLIALAFSSLRPDQMARGASLYHCCRATCAAIGSSIAITLWERREAVHHAHLAEHLNVYDPVVRDSLEALQRLGMDELQSIKHLAKEITRQSYMLSANEIYWGCTLLFLALIAVVWMAKPQKQPGA